MKRLYEKTIIETCLKQTKFESVMRDFQTHLFVTQYEKGELVTTPLQKEHLFQIIIQGSIRDDGSVYSLANS